MFIDGEAILVPAGIGINIEDPEPIHFEDNGSYGGIELCNQPCISPLHTHDESGIIHTESSDPEPHTLGQFFVEWGVELSETCVGEHGWYFDFSLQPRTNSLIATVNVVPTPTCLQTEGGP